MQSLTFRYTPDNLIKTITNAVDATVTTSLVYDSVNRLSSYTVGGSTTTDTFDGIGNRSTRTVTGNAARTYGYQGGGSQLTSVAGAESRALTYGSDGNLTGETGTNGTRTYGYDNFLQMNSATVAGQVNTYYYNAFGERTRKVSPVSGSHRFVYHSQNQLLAERNETSGAWTNYIYMGSKVVGLIRGGQLYYVHSDHLDRPEVITNSAKTVVWRAKNYPGFRTVALTTIGEMNLGLPGQYWDGETGLWYNGFRYYDAELGRYTQVDPIGFAGGVNTYAYAFGNPDSLH